MSGKSSLWLYEEPWLVIVLVIVTLMIMVVIRSVAVAMVVIMCMCGVPVAGVVLMRVLVRVIMRMAAGGHAQRGRVQSALLLAYIELVVHEPVFKLVQGLCE
jgi:Na+/H+-translocating membrane pyrophosphatase